MTRRILALLLSAAAVTSLQGQARPQFEVASVRPSPEQAQAQAQVGVQITSAQVRFTYLSLRDYIGIAYDLKAPQISGPDWISTTRFDIAATLAAGADQAQMPAMLQTLLDNRFQLTSHRESREFPVYALEVVGSGLKLEKLPDDPGSTAAAGAPLTITASGSGRGVAIDLGGGSSYAFADSKFEGRKLTMSALAEALESFVDRPIVDMTKTEGRFNVTLPVSPEDYQGMLIRAAVTNGVALPPQVVRMLDTASIGSLIDALRNVGLSLQTRRAPLDVLVVDSIQRMPTEN